MFSGGISVLFFNSVYWLVLGIFKEKNGIWRVDCIYVLNYIWSVDLSIEKYRV